jgi:hypothetical protein
MVAESAPIKEVRSCRMLVAALAMAVMVAAISVRANTAGAPDLVVTNLRIPTRESGKKGLAAVMVRPNDSLPHPLALLAHGTPRDITQITPLDY